MKTSARKLLSLLTGLAAMIAVCAPVRAETNPPTLKTKPCFQCKATGEIKCPVASCVNGQMDCPAPCIKLRVGKWVKRPDLHRPDPNETMQKVKVGNDTWDISSHHEGVIYIPKGDKEIEMVTCKVCNGTTRVTCKTCAGKGLLTCPVCEGKQVVPESWTAFDHPRMKERPSRYKLKDGRELLGRKISAIGSSLRIRTETGDVNVDAAEIVSEEKQATQK